METIPWLGLAERPFEPAIPTETISIATISPLPIKRELPMTPQGSLNIADTSERQAVGFWFTIPTPDRRDHCDEE
jgi:hypothetical protein